MYIENNHGERLPGFPPSFQQENRVRHSRARIGGVFQEALRPVGPLSALQALSDRGFDSSGPLCVQPGLPSLLSPPSQFPSLSLVLSLAELPSPSLLPSHLAVLLARELLAAPSDGLRLVLDIPANTASLSLVSVSQGLYSTLWSRRLAVCVGSAVDAQFLAYATRVGSPLFDIQRRRRGSWVPKWRSRARRCGSCGERWWSARSGCRRR